jgi:hypothetical protein
LPDWSVAIIPRRFVSKSFLGLALVAILGWPQPHVGQSQASLTTPRLDKGVIQGKTYRNASIGLDFTSDPSLTFQHPDVKENGTKRESLAVSALGKATPGSVREGTFLGAVALAYYPEDQRSTDACMRKVVVAQLKNGFKTVVGTSNSKLGHITFARTDFSHDDPPAYEAVFVKACDALALTVVFAGHDRDTVERFVAATDLKLDPSVSGCRSQDK